MSSLSASAPAFVPSAAAQKEGLRRRMAVLEDGGGSSSGGGDSSGGGGKRQREEDGQQSSLSVDAPEFVPMAPQDDRTPKRQKTLSAFAESRCLLFQRILGRAQVSAQRFRSGR